MLSTLQYLPTLKQNGSVCKVWSSDFRQTPSEVPYPSTWAHQSQSGPSQRHHHDHQGKFFKSCICFISWRINHVKSIQFLKIKPEFPKTRVFKR